MNTNNDFPKEMIFDKKLNDEELELLRREYQKILSINKMKMDSISYQLYLDKNKEVLLPRGALLYGIEASLSNLEYISKLGILAPEFRGLKEDGSTYYCAYFDKIEADTLLRCYDKTSILSTNMPFNRINNNIAFIINPTSKIGGLLYYDLLDSKFDNNPIVKNIIDREEDSNKNHSAILGGIPSNAISGIILGDKVLLDDGLTKEIMRLFPMSYIVTRDGKIIRDRSNIIKIEDFEDISLKYAKSSSKNNIFYEDNLKLQKENNNLKKELTEYIKIVKENTTSKEQAKILIALGYKSIPTSLKSKLTKEELKEIAKDMVSV